MLKIFKQWLYIFMLLFLCINKSHAQAVGKVISLKGGLYAIGADHSKRQLSYHSEIYAGDVLVTSASTHAQVLFSDNSIVALPSGSNYQINQYHYQSNNHHNRFVSTLLKGALRTITGEIARSNPTQFSSNSPVATIGVRGTFFGTELSSKGQLVCVKKGGIVVSNRMGSVPLGAGARYDFAIVPSANQAPYGSSQSPEFLFKYFSEHLYSGQTPNISNGYNGHRTPVLDQDIYYESDAYLFTDFPERLQPQEVRALIRGG